jgi:chromosome segregation ATPase
MTSVQENKNELEAAVRYCESAISRAKQTIESMEFRQQAASKAWHEQTGRESALEHAVNDLKLKYDKMKDYTDKLLDENVTVDERNEELKTQLVEWRDRSSKYTEEIATLKDQLAEREDKWDQAMLENTKLNDRLMISTKEVGQLQSEVDELAKAYKDSTHEEITMKKAWREQRELVALRDDQIAMLERRLAKYTGEKVYPFKEGDLYYVFNQLDGTWIESVWDHESERIHDTPSMPNHPHKVYFTIDQKHVLDKFKPEDD